jgi:Fur family ferric uptake transcriptional regulator
MGREPRSSLSILQNAGLRRTPVRSAVLNLLSKAPNPLGVPDMLGKLPPDTDAVTVYRTLNTFVNQKIVHRVQADDRTWRYAMGNHLARESVHRHPHFVCDHCHTVECLDAAEIPLKLPEKMGVARGYRVSYPEVVLHGKCPKCK